MTKGLTHVLAALALVTAICGPAGAADYPTLYRELGLPEFPQAVVQAVGRDNSNLTDGLRIQLKTPASSAKLREFFEKRMTELGWVLQETIAMKKMRKAGMLGQLPFNAAFCRSDGTVYQVTTVNLGSERHLNITVNKGSNSC